MMCCTLDDVLYIELVAELSANITFKHIIVEPVGSRVVSSAEIVWSLFRDQLKVEVEMEGWEQALLWVLVA